MGGEVIPPPLYTGELEGTLLIIPPLYDEDHDDDVVGFEDG